MHDTVLSKYRLGAFVLSFSIVRTDSLPPQLQSSRNSQLAFQIWPSFLDPNVGTHGVIWSLILLAALFSSNCQSTPHTASSITTSSQWLFSVYALFLWARLLAEVLIKTLQHQIVVVEMDTKYPAITIDSITLPQSDNIIFPESSFFKNGCVNIKLPTPGLSGGFGRQSLREYIFRDCRRPAGPFPTVKTFNDYFIHLMWTGPGLPDPKYIHPQRAGLPDNVPVFFTHADLTPTNIILSPSQSGQPTRVVAIIDWHQSGWYPAFWEACKSIYNATPNSTWGKGLPAVFAPYHELPPPFMWMRNAGVGLWGPNPRDLWSLLTMHMVARNRKYVDNPNEESENWSSAFVAWLISQKSCHRKNPRKL